jgi:hypothetical protein
MNCKKCGREMRPAPAKLRADGEQTYVGFISCLCDQVISTDYGALHPQTEEHDLYLKNMYEEE